MKAEIHEIIGFIKNEKIFEATAADGSFTINIKKYVPYCCTAIHAGNKLRSELQDKIHHNEYERWYEEDPHTDDFIISLPITVVVHDSRYEYDLNRPSEQCIYTVAWDKPVWKRKLTPKEVQRSKQKHANFYKVLHALVQKLENMFGGCVVFDMHSYNHKRWERNVPLFNIGTERINQEKFGPMVKRWAEELQSVQLEGIENVTSINNVFYGRGYCLEYISSHFKETLVLATEIKKVYCDEESGDIYPDIIGNLQLALKTVILNAANIFCENLVKWKHISVNKLLEKDVSNNLFSIDKKLFDLLKNFELLATVNPINSASEKKRFFRNKFTELPSFKYHPIKVNVYDLKQKLMSLPVQHIKDISLKNLYESVINSYFDKIELIGTRGTSKFLYNSLRYFGRPSKQDLLNAQYLLHLPDVPEEIIKEPFLNATQAMSIFREKLHDYGIQAKVEQSTKVISQIMVLNSKRSIQFSPEAQFRRKELHALIEHEIGVHMVTTMNSNMQKLKVFNLGLPVNTLTQEGLAILAEYLSGNLTLRRLKKFAYRVVVVDMMCSGADFIDCFNLLQKEHKVPSSDAFSIVTRIFRGGGFTKDHLYLRGFVKILKYWQEHNNIEPLLVGKTSLDFIHTIEEMIGREMIDKPFYVTKSFKEPNINSINPIYKYILSGIR